LKTIFREISLQSLSQQQQQHQQQQQQQQQQHFSNLFVSASFMV